jgi:hypothetical protein
VKIEWTTTYKLVTMYMIIPAACLFLTRFLAAPLMPGLDKAFLPKKILYAAAKYKLMNMNWMYQVSLDE